jgi:hypothetical protein
MGALALGVILVTPLLSGASGGSMATGQVGRRALERYSMDAGIEWSGWRLLSDPELTTVTSFTATPLLPFPAAVNGAAFPTTEIRFMPAAGAVEGRTLPWQSGGGTRCYAISASDAGTLSARIGVDAGQVQAAVIASAAPCLLPPLTPVYGVAPEVRVDFALASAGSYQLVIATNAATTGTLDLSVPAATYEVRSQNGSRNVVARIVAGYGGIRMESWQLN